MKHKYKSLNNEYRIILDISPHVETNYVTIKMAKKHEDTTIISDAL